MNKASVSFFTVSDENEGQRIDNFLFKHLKNVPKTHIYKLIRTGDLRINKKRVQAHYPLQIGDLIRIPPLYRANKPEKTHTIPHAWNTRIQSLILLENEDFLIINKPRGLPVHAGSNEAFGIIEILKFTFPHLSALTLAHRLDKETSGCLCIAKKRQSLLKLQTLFKTRNIEKIYYLIAQGKWPKTLQDCQIPLRKTHLPDGQCLVSADPSGKTSHTLFQLQRYLPANLSLVKVLLQTGRTHQIRAHASLLGYPILGDEKYGPWQKKTAHRKHKPLCLHAFSLNFQWEGKEITATAPFPAHFREYCDAI